MPKKTYVERSSYGQGSTIVADKRQSVRLPTKRSAEWFTVLRPYLDGDAPLTKIAEEAGISLRTARRWVAQIRKGGPAALNRKQRADNGVRRLSQDLINLAEGLALMKPRLSIATVHRRVCKIAYDKGWKRPSYSSIYSIVSQLNPAMMTLAHEGAAVFRDHYEFIHRHRAERPNAIWQADHTQLDIIILDANGKEVRPWLTTVIDDYSRAVAGYTVFIGAPSALNTSLALRQAIWRKPHTDWPICGIPDVLYVDHGSDFTSIHLEQAAADLHFQIIYSAIARPQGRGKVERLFGTINTELLPNLPGQVRKGVPASRPSLSLSELDAAVGEFFVGSYNTRIHSAIGVSPINAWRSNGWIPRLPDDLEALNLLLVMVAKPRIVRRDGIHFEGLRFLDPTLAAYVGEVVTIRYDPRDMGEIRLFHRNAFLCRAVNTEHADQNITLKDVQTARAANRRNLQLIIKEKRSRVADFLPVSLSTFSAPLKQKSDVPLPKRPRLQTYIEDTR